MSASCGVQLAAPRHGGNVQQASEETGIPLSGILDFSASINPLGMPESAARALRDGIGQLVHYPDPYAEPLSRHLAGRLGLDPQSVLCANGSTELIYLIARALAPRTVLVPAPTFSEYERACLLVPGCSCRRLPLSPERDFAITPDAVIGAMAGCDAVFLCNPNNPTGGLLGRDAVLAIADAAERLSCRLIVDEAFIDFAPGGSLVHDVAGRQSLIVLRSLTKFYALPGLRAGYGVFPPALRELLLRHKEPWTVNTPAQQASIAALGDAEHGDRTRAVIVEEKRRLERGFSSLGITWFPSAANYYLLRTARAQEIIAALRTKGLLLRDCSNFPGLDDTYFRVAVRSAGENAVLLKELELLWAA